MEPKQIVDRMMEKDYFSEWLGIQIIEILEGKAVLEMQIKKEMLNGFGIAHGGITYSLADSALAFAANSKGMQSVSIETSISHLNPLKEGDTIKAESNLVSSSNKLERYEINITKEKELVAHFKGTVYRTSKVWE